MHLDHLPPGQLVVVSAPRAQLNGIHHELLRQALHESPQPPVFLDGDQSLSCSQFAEHNFRMGDDGHFGRTRIVTCRHMTPFQWSVTLMEDFRAILTERQPSLVLAGYFNTQFEKTEDLKDWEQEGYVRDALAFMKAQIAKTQTRAAITIDLGRWTITHPSLAVLIHEARLPLRFVERTPRGYVVVNESGEVLQAPGVLPNDLERFMQEIQTPPVELVPSLKTWTNKFRR